MLALGEMIGKAELRIQEVTKLQGYSDEATLGNPSLT